MPADCSRERLRPLFYIFRIGGQDFLNKNAIFNKKLLISRTGAELGLSLAVSIFYISQTGSAILKSGLNT
ncbi:hypothetical protein DPQ22_06020 [Candidatus Tokpelaia sp.]|nr:hypothetical protein DPQ22_06020 [Candidatus Tokpelaia sp.]